MLDMYTNQTITWKQKVSVNDANKATYTTSTLKGRFIYKRNLIRTATDEQIMSDAILYTKTVIVEGDVIVADSKDWKVRFVYPWRELDGSVLGYKVVL